MSNIYNIPAERNFADTLAHWVLETYGSDPLQLPHVLILLPSRRSCLALRDSFLRASDGRPLLLPRMQPLGDIDEDLLILGNDWQVMNTPPAPDFTFRRQFILTRLIMQQHKFRLDHALKLASELARLFDELEREQVSLKELINIVPEDFAEHWQTTVEFLKILSVHWPDICTQENIVSPANYRNKILGTLAKEWKNSPPDHSVIVAGTTGSIPATAELITTIAHMPGGTVVLPAFDTTADKKYLEHVAEGHPQWGMLRLLEKAGCTVEDVKELSCCLQAAGRRERTQLLSEIMCPAEVSERWQTVTLDMAKALSGICQITCADIQEEAHTISLILRETLEYPEKTAALITHDRILARQVCANIQRFGIRIDDSAGIPLAHTPIATFLRLIAEVAANDSHAVSTLALLKHPLTHAGMGRLDCLEATREYEKEIVRSDRLDNAKVPRNVKILLRNLEEILAPFRQRLKKSLPLTVSHLPYLITAHMQCAETLAGEDLWNGQEAESIMDLLSELSNSQIKQEASGEPGKPFHEYSCYREVFDVLLSGKVFRPEYGSHPRLKILGPIEARMQSFDRIILGGLNEGSWPQDTIFDPWLNRKMRKDIGLPAPERDIGLAAHDFFTLASAPEVYLTRSEKISGAPATPSRWLVKLGVLLARYSSGDVIQNRHWQAMATELDSTETFIKSDPPAPKPPLAARPKTLSVTQIETLVRNPYAIYASKILKLEPLQPIMRELNGSDFGNAVHKVLERFVREYPSELPANAYDTLIEYSKETLQPFLANDRVKALWWPRFVRIAEFIIEHERLHRTQIKRILAEVTESYAIDGFILTGRADRIEELHSGGISIIDYKTGALPTNPDIEKGLTSQLILLGLIMQSKGNVIKALEYWRLQGGADAGIIKQLSPEKVTGYIEAAEEGLRNLIEKYNNPGFPYRSTPYPAHTGLYNDYEHLARIKEWEN